MVHSKDKKALLAYGEGQSFQSSLSSQIPCSRAEGLLEGQEQETDRNRILYYVPGSMVGATHT